MKLELKYLAPYPMNEDTGLLVQTKLRTTTSSGNTLGFKTGRLIGISTRTDVELVFDKDDFSEDFDLKEVKPILRPLSDLTDEERREFSDTFRLYCRSERFDVNLMILMDFNKACEKHIDVFGLIEKGLAIDVNTLSKID